MALIDGRSAFRLLAATRGSMALGVVGLLALAISPAHGSGAWTTFLRPYSYSDLLATGDTVWCATLEAGLVRFTPSTGGFEFLAREPGGLASNRLSSLALDGSGRLWVGTLGAGASLLTLEGARWGAVNAFDGLPSDTVTVLEAVGDTMWVGTPRGVALWSGREISGTLPDPTSPSPFANDRVTGIAAFGDTLWIATAVGIYRGLISTGLNPVTPVNAGLNTLAIRSLASDGVTLLALADSVYRFNRVAGSWQLAGGIGSVLRISDDYGVVWAASRLGVYRWGGEGWVFEAFLPSDESADLCTPGDDLCGLYAITTDPAGAFYAANHRGVHSRPAGTIQVFEPASTPGNDVLNVEIEGRRVYFTTRVEGIGRLEGSKWRNWPLVSMQTDTTFLRPIFPFALQADRSGQKWVGCFDQALERFDDSISPPFFFHHWPVMQPPARSDTVASHTFAWGSALDSSGGVWFGMHSPREEELPDIGLDHYDASGAFVANYRPGTSPLTGGRIHALTVDRNRRVWFGYVGRGGIGHFAVPATPGGPLAITHIENTENDDVRGIAAHDTSIWVLTTSELRRYSLFGALRARFTVPAPPADNSTRPVAVGADGAVWLGTVNGLRVYRPNGTFEDFTTANSPLAGDEVRAIRIDPSTGWVWIGTARGVNRFDPAFVPTVPEIPRLVVQLFPNPARINQVNLGLRLNGNATAYEGRILDLTGRLVQRFRAAGNGQVIWDGRDLRGARVEPGIYFVRVQAGGRVGVARVVLLR